MGVRILYESHAARAGGEISPGGSDLKTEASCSRKDRDASVRFPLQAGPSPVEGTGVFAGARIPQRAKIGEVTGEIISLRLARKRARGRCRMCLVDVSDTQALDCTRGNVLRHLNHSCGANAFLRIHQGRVEVYARRVIRKGEEITVDYGVSPHRGGMACRCGHASCRGSI